MSNSKNPKGSPQIWIESFGQKISGTYWIESFKAWLSKRNVRPGDWEDLTVNPIVKVEQAYTDSWTMGAVITLEDGTTYRWDALHGCGFWHIRVEGWRWISVYAYRHASWLAREARDYERFTIERAEFPNRDESILLEDWVAADEYTQKCALSAVQWFACLVCEAAYEESHGQT